MTRKLAIIGVSIGLSLALAACGETQGERGLAERRSAPAPGLPSVR